MYRKFGQIPMREDLAQKGPAESRRANPLGGLGTGTNSYEGLSSIPSVDFDPYGTRTSGPHEAVGHQIRAVFLVAFHITDGIANTMFNIQKTAIVTGQTGEFTFAFSSFPKSLFVDIESLHVSAEKVQSL
jgi:hypothetical protein